MAYSWVYLVVFSVAFLAIAIYLRSKKTMRTGCIEAMDVLNESYAENEISSEEYDEIKQRILSNKYEYKAFEGSKRHIARGIIKFYK